MVGNLTETEIRSLLEAATHAHLGCHSEGRTYVVPISYTLDGNRLLGYTTEGTKIRMMRENPEVCVQVEQVQSFTDWRSAILWGTFEEVTGPAAAEAMRKIIDRYAESFTDPKSRHGREVTPPRPEGAAHANRVVYAINIRETSGRFERP